MIRATGWFSFLALETLNLSKARQQEFGRMTQVHGSRRALGIVRFIDEPALVIEEIFYL